MKRIYVSFFTTVFVALVMTMIAFLTKNDMQHLVNIDKQNQEIVQDSASSEINRSNGSFN